MLPPCWEAVTSGGAADRRAPADGGDGVREWPDEPAVGGADPASARATTSCSERAPVPTETFVQADGPFTQLPPHADAGRRRHGWRETTHVQLTRCRGSPGCSPFRCAGRSPVAARRRPTPSTTPRPRRPDAVVGAARPPRPAGADRARAARRGVDVVGVRQHAVHPDRQLRRRRLRRRRHRRRRRRLDRAGRHHPRPAGRRARRPHRPPPGRHGDGRGRARRHGDRAPSPRRSRSSSPPRRSAGRSGWRSTSSSPSSPPRRCHATAGRTRSACWRWPADSAPAWP